MRDLYMPLMAAGAEGQLRAIPEADGLATDPTKHRKIGTGRRLDEDNDRGSGRDRQKGPTDEEAGVDPRPSPTEVFTEALRGLVRDGATAPTSFRDYARQTGFDLRRATPEYISVDSYSRLPVALRTASAMVFRLGEAEGTGTQFSVVRVTDRLRDFFVFDEEVFAPTSIETYLPEASARSLFPFYLVDASSETNIVNLAFASGALAEALDLDQPPMVPAVGRGRYSFSFRPHSSLDVVLHHRAGQVEVDAMFIGRRRGRQCLFVLEAKVGGSQGSLALHKLAYPCLAFRPSLPSDIPIIPVYLRAARGDAGTLFSFALFDEVPEGELVLDAMRMTEVRRLRIPRGTV